VPWAGDEDPVGAFAADTCDPALRERGLLHSSVVAQARAAGRPVNPFRLPWPGRGMPPRADGCRPARPASARRRVQPTGKSNPTADTERPIGSARPGIE
jgi:hypothetical protein